MSSSQSRPSTVQFVVTAVIGVVSGVLYQVLAIGYGPVQALLAFVPQGASLIVGGWLYAGTLAALIVRRPGAAVAAELLAATVEALLGSSWGWATLYYGLLEGLAVEVVFLAWRYRSSGLLPAVLGGTLSGLSAAALDLTLYYPTLDATAKVQYTVGCAVSGAVVAGVLAWLLVRALRPTGVLTALGAADPARV